MFLYLQEIFFYICEKKPFIKECLKVQLYLRDIFFIEKCPKAPYVYKWVYMRMGFLSLLENKV